MDDPLIIVTTIFLIGLQGFLIAAIAKDDEKLLRIWLFGSVAIGPLLIALLQFGIIESHPIDEGFPMPYEDPFPDI